MHSSINGHLSCFQLLDVVREGVQDRSPQDVPLKKKRLDWLIYWFLERWGGKEKERGRDINVQEKHRSIDSQTPPTGDPACNRGMCPDQESNRWPFGSQACAQSTEPHQPGQDVPLWHKDYIELKTILFLQAQEKLYLSVKEFKWRALPVIRIIARYKFLWPIYRAGQTSNYWVSALLIILWITLFPGWSLRPLSHSLAQDNIQISFCLLSSHLSCMWGSHMYQVKFIFLLLICLRLISLLDQLKEPLFGRVKFFLPDTNNAAVHIGV